jgi:tetratricopeptide (TPR) repeat protein
LDRSQPLRLRGLALLLAGRYREAEENLRLAIAATKSGAEQARTLENLGDSLMEQGRYDEASGSYEAALRSQTGYLGPYRGMAELLLRRHQDPQRALEFVENSPSGPAWNRWTLTGDTRDDYWALKAWALAELGRTGEVGPAIENAMRATNRKSRPAMAATFYRAGMAMQALGKDKPAAEYFTRARAADPKGRWNGAGRQLAAGCPPALFAPRTPPGT